MLTPVSLNIGIIGAGNIAKAHMIAARKVNGINLCGVYDLEYQKAQQFDAAITPYLYAAELIERADAIIINCHTESRSCRPRYLRYK